MCVQNESHKAQINAWISRKLLITISLQIYLFHSFSFSLLRLSLIWSQLTLNHKRSIHSMWYIAVANHKYAPNNGIYLYCIRWLHFWTSNLHFISCQTYTLIYQCRVYHWIVSFRFASLYQWHYSAMPTTTCHIKTFLFTSTSGPRSLHCYFILRFSHICEWYTVVHSMVTINI